MATLLALCLWSWVLPQVAPAPVQLQIRLDARRPACVLSVTPAPVPWHADMALALGKEAPMRVALGAADRAWLELNAPARLGALDLTPGRYGAALLLAQSVRLQLWRLPGTTPVTGSAPAAREVALDRAEGAPGERLEVECVPSAKAPPHGQLTLHLGPHRFRAPVQFLDAPPAATLAGTRKLAADWRGLLECADRFEIVALDPSVQARQKPGARWHDWPVLGTKVLDARAAQHELLGLVYQGIEHGDAIAKCFDPRHGIRATWQGQTVDLLICYECLQVHVYAGEGHEPTVLATADTVEPRVSALFRRFGLTIAKR